MSFLRAMVVALVLVSVSAAQEVRTLANKTIQGSVVEITNQEITVKDKEGKLVKTPLSQVLSIDFRGIKKIPESEKYTLVRLFDDSELYCTDIAFQGDKIQVTLLTGQKATIPLKSLVGMLRNAHDKDLRKQFDEFSNQNSKTDRVLVLRSGQLNPLEGVIGEADEKGERIQFRSAAGSVIAAKLDSIQGMIFNRTAAPSEAPICLVMDVYGNTLAAVDVSVKDQQFMFTTPTGAKFQFAESALAKLDYNRGKLTFLSDMEPVEVVERSAIGLIIKYRKDTNLDGDPIRLGKNTHSKGLSMHAHTELEYDLRGKYKDFKAVLGVDNRAGSESKAIITIKCDGVQVFHQPVNPLQPQPIAVNVRDVNRLRIIVSSSNVLDLHDHAVLADARISQ